jgi:hypothetical protein
MRAVLLLLVASLAAGCTAFAFGTPYPGARVRYREYVRCEYMTGPNTCMGHLESETGGGSPHGWLVGFRVGPGQAELGQRSGGGVAGDLRLEYDYTVRPWLALGADVGFGYVFASDDADDTELGHVGFPVGAHATIVPLTPFVLRAGAAYVPGTVRLGEERYSTAAVDAFVGAGMSVPFPGMHLVLLLEARHRESGAIAEAGGDAFSADMLLWDLWLVF